MPPADPSIRLATAEDAAVLGEIHVRAHRFGYRGALPDAYLDRLDAAERADAWRELLAAPPASLRVWLAERGGEAVGFTGIEEPGEEDGSLPPGTALLHWLHARPNHIGTGVGRALMRHALDAMQGEGYRYAVLWVLEGNRRARRFYEAGGWRHDGAARERRYRAGDVEATATELRYARSVAEAAP